jgi:hypothetical protein
MMNLLTTRDHFGTPMNTPVSKLITQRSVVQIHPPQPTPSNRSNHLAFHPKPSRSN